MLDSIIKNGQVTRGYLGALIQDLSDDLAKSFGYDSTAGVLIGDVVEDGPAAKAGLKPGDLMTEFDGKAVQNLYDFTYALRGKEPGDIVSVVVRRNGQDMKVNVTLEARR